MNKYLAIAVLLGGCSLAPDFMLPETNNSNHFKEAEKVEGQWKEAKAAEAIDKGEWWKVFGDAELNALIDEMHKNNNDLAAAAARAKQVAALADYEGGRLLPVIRGNASVNRRKDSDNTIAGSFQQKPYNNFGLGLDVSYELDIFGKVSDSVEAAEKDFESAEAAYKNIMLLLEANLAQNYFALKATQAQVKLMRNSISYREEQNAIIKKREELGGASGLDLNLAETQLANIKLQSLELEKQNATLEHSLAVLLGKVPSDVEVKGAEFNFTQVNIPAGIPSEVLQRRPDVASAVRTLEAENARVGLARASFFPDITLTSGFGFQSMELGDLLKWSSRTWYLGPLGPIVEGVLFDGGRYSARVEGQDARYAEVSANYKQAVLTAFQEVEDNLSTLGFLNEQMVQAEKSYKASSEAQKMTQIKYDAGASSYYELKDIQLEAINSEQQRIETQKQIMLTQVALIKALGGGWSAQNPSK